MNTRFNKFFIYSVLFHLLGSIIFYFVSKNEKKYSVPKISNTKAIQVDVVGLPQKKLSQLKKIDLQKKLDKKKSTIKISKKELPKKKVKKIAKKKSAIKKKEETLPQVKKKQLEKVSKEKQANLNNKQVADNKPVIDNKNSAEDKELLNDKIANIRKNLKSKYTQEVSKERKDIADPEYRKEIMYGNIKSEGTAPSGAIGSEAINYENELRRHVKRFWEIPSWFDASPFKAKVLVKVMPNGYIFSVGFIERSGNINFDKHVLEAVRNSEPLPTPPIELQSFYQNRGLPWLFRGVEN